MLSSRTRIKVGDVFEIPLPNNKKTYGQYILWDERYGPLVRIFNLIVHQEQPPDLQKIVQQKILFPPVFTGLYAAIRQEIWHVIGNSPVEKFEFPSFLTGLINEHGKVNMWSIRDSKASKRIGPVLPKRYKNLEYLVVWNPPNLTKRIETGENPYDRLKDLSQ
ncbi:hypothetical protein HY410_00045 [Candidatus Gottesmanbacteria bacterium]|nr:hypothetical protein [Candidatus Gottesmanbacteria bacterium]